MQFASFKFLFISAQLLMYTWTHHFGRGRNGVWVAETRGVIQPQVLHPNNSHVNKFNMLKCYVCQWNNIFFQIHEWTRFLIKVILNNHVYLWINATPTNGCTVSSIRHDLSTIDVWFHLWDMSKSHNHLLHYK